MHNRTRIEMFVEYFEKNIWMRFFALPIVLFSIIYWVLDKSHSWINPKVVNSSDWPIVIFVLSCVGAAAIFGVLITLFIILADRKRNADLLLQTRVITSPSEIFEEELPNSRDIRIFASSGSEAEKLFVYFIRNSGVLKNDIKIQVLLRSESGNQDRLVALQARVNTWKIDIGEPVLGGFKIQTSFALYQSPVMLYGYVFDRRVAMLAWYSRCGNYRSPSLPLIYLKRGVPTQNNLIEAALKTFDCHFNLGQRIQ